MGAGCSARNKPSAFSSLSPHSPHPRHRSLCTQVTLLNLFYLTGRVIKGENIPSRSGQYKGKGQGRPSPIQPGVDKLRSILLLQTYLLFFFTVEGCFADITRYPGSPQELRISPQSDCVLEKLIQFLGKHSLCFPSFTL